jgi:2-aminoadipate transaminase
MLNKINIDRKNRIPLYLQIKKQIQDMIINDIISEGINLPPTRKLSRTLGVNRNTVVSAYNELVADGLIESRVGSGSSVKRKNFVGKESLIYQPLDWSELSVFPKATLIDSLFKDIIDVCSIKNIISFASGVPAPECLPVVEFQEIITDLLRKEGRVILQRLPTAGHYSLRKMLAHWMNLEGKPTSPDEVLIISGSQQGIYLLTETLLDPGGVIVVESPTYLGALQVFKAAGARTFSIPVDENGMRVENSFILCQHSKILVELFSV